MPFNKITYDKATLLAEKQRILDDILYCETSIAEIRAKSNLSDLFIEDDDSSDSEDGFPVSLERGPTIPQLKLQQSSLQTCLQATQELTNLQILESEVNVLAEAPELSREPPITDPGTWKEVSAECRIDLIPFSMTFYVHQPSGKFSSPRYRGLRVTTVKTAHEVELSKSVLPKLVRPSDAVEVLKSYSIAYRSRRTTLAKLADKYSASLHMEPMNEGGYLLKCANLLEVSWSLESKFSPVAAFHHRMKFDLEYMDESYISKISDSHKNLCDPNLTTDERTLLLAKIITVCLEVQKTREITQQEEAVEVTPNVMAPPKIIPKKSTKAVKRSMPEENVAKKTKNHDENEENDFNINALVDNIENKRKTIDTIAKENSESKIDKVTNITDKKIVKKVKNLENEVTNVNDNNYVATEKCNRDAEKVTKKVKTAVNIQNKDKSNKINTKKPKDAPKNVTSKEKDIATTKTHKVTEKNNQIINTKTDTNKNKEKSTEKNVIKDKNTTKSQNKATIQNAKSENDKNLLNTNKNNVKKDILSAKNSKMIPKSSINIKNHRNSKDVGRILSNEMKKSKIPHIKSPNIENIKKNMLRISPRRIPANFKTIENKQKMMKTNIPRLLKPVPKIK